MNGPIGFQEFSLADVAYLIDGSLSIQASDVTMASGQTSSITPDHRHPPGTTLVKLTSSGKYYLANGATGDRNTAASITSSGHTDGNGTIKLVGNHGTISVTTATGAGTEANNATDLNADAIFKAHYVASSAAGELTIASLAAGLDEWFYMHSDTQATSAFAEGVANAVKGTDADYRVATLFAELKDINATAQDDRVGTLYRGHFDESECAAMTAEARAVFLRRGSRFG